MESTKKRRVLAGGEMADDDAKLIRAYVDLYVPDITTQEILNASYAIPRTPGIILFCWLYFFNVSCTISKAGTAGGSLKRRTGREWCGDG